MANDVHIENTQATAKIRSIWVMLLLAVITFGIYTAFLWYFLNRELRDLGRGRATTELGTSPATSVVAYTLGSIVYVPLIVTVISTSKRVQRAQALTGEQPFNGWAAAAVWILSLGLAGPFYLQYQLNKVWHAPGMRPVEAVAGPETTSGDLQRAAKLDQLHAAGALTAPELEHEKVRLGFAPAAPVVSGETG